MLLAMLSAKQHKKQTVWVRRWLLNRISNLLVVYLWRVTAHINCVDPISQVCRVNTLLANHSSAF